MRRHTVAVIDRFTDWFGSVGCVVETFLLCMAVAAFEAFRPAVDPHNFKFLYAATLYSAFTQPALAYAAYRAQHAADRALTELESEMDLLQQLATNQADTLRALLALLDDTGRR